jgi:long-chain acyl-CoA synthetase
VVVPVNAKLHPREVEWIIANAGAQWGIGHRDVAPSPLAGLAHQIDVASAEADSCWPPVPDLFAVPVTARGPTMWPGCSTPAAPRAAPRA